MSWCARPSSPRLALLALALAFAPPRALSARAPAAAIVEMTADNFDALAASGDWLIEFYAPWCGHCKQLAPDLERAAKKLAAAGSATRVARIDATAWHSLAFRFGVGGYPTFFHVHNGGPGLGPLAREVRHASVEHSYEGVLRAAEPESWARSAPLAWQAGPFGPFAMAKFWAVFYGERAFKLHEPIAAYLGAPPVFVQFAFGMALLSALTGLLIGCAVWVGHRERRAVTAAIARHEAAELAEAAAHAHAE